MSTFEDELVAPQLNSATKRAAAKKDRLREGKLKKETEPA
jgi:hypothetical protein